MIKHGIEPQSHRVAQNRTNSTDWVTIKPVTGPEGIQNRDGLRCSTGRVRFNH